MGPLKHKQAYFFICGVLSRWLVLTNSRVSNSSVSELKTLSNHWHIRAANRADHYTHHHLFFLLYISTEFSPISLHITVLVFMGMVISIEVAWLHRSEAADRILSFQRLRIPVVIWSGLSCSCFIACFQRVHNVIMCIVYKVMTESPNHSD